MMYLFFIAVGLAFVLYCKNALAYSSDKVLYSLPFRRFSSFFINTSSRLVCPLMLLFSCARRMRYGITSRIGPNGKYLLTEYPALARLKVILSLMPYNCEKCTCGWLCIIPFASISSAARRLLYSLCVATTMAIVSILSMQ